MPAETAAVARLQDKGSLIKLADLQYFFSDRARMLRNRRALNCSATLLHDPCHCYRGPPISARTFEGSFSAVWVPTIARVGAFFPKR